MNVMHLLATAGTGGIESLCKDYLRYLNHNKLASRAGLKNFKRRKESSSDGNCYIKRSLRKR